MKSLKLLGAAVAVAATVTLSPQVLAVGNLADVNVFDRSEGRQLPVYWHDGRAYVVGKPGNEYQLSVRNRQGAEMLAVKDIEVHQAADRQRLRREGKRDCGTQELEGSHADSFTLCDPPPWPAVNT